MTTPDDLVKRLRRAHDHDGLRLPAEAADRIERLERENADLSGKAEMYRAGIARLELQLLTARSQARKDALEEAARICDEEAGFWGGGAGQGGSASTAANRIRALKDKEVEG